MKRLLLLSFFLPCHGALPPAPAQLDVRISQLFPRTPEEILNETTLSKEGHTTSFAGHHTRSHLSGVIIESGNETTIQMDPVVSKSGSGSESQSSHSTKFLAIVSSITGIVVGLITAGVTIAVTVKECKQ